MSVIEEAKGWLINDCEKGECEQSILEAYTIIGNLIKELETHKEVVRAAEWYQRTGYGDDPLAQPHLDEALEKLSKDNG